MKKTLLIVMMTAVLGLTSTTINASESCGKDESAPLPDCVKLLRKGGGTTKLQNYCDYDIDIKIDKHVEFDERIILKANHEKNVVSRAAINFVCCWKSTPQCAH